MGNLNRGCSWVESRNVSRETGGWLFHVKHSGSAVESANYLVTMQPIQLRDNPEMYRQTIQTLEFDTRGRGLHDITARLASAAEETRITDGLVTLFLRHTSASLLIQENADPNVLGDLERFMARLVPDGDPLYRHRDEGPDDMPAHVRAALTAVQLSIPMHDGKLMLGTWQAIYLWEQRTHPHRRQIVVHVAGDGGAPSLQG